MLPSDAFKEMDSRKTYRKGHLQDGSGWVPQLSVEWRVGTCSQQPRFQSCSQDLRKPRRVRIHHGRSSTRSDSKRSCEKRWTSRAVKCHNCGEYGHWARDCPKKTNKTREPFAPKLQVKQEKPSKESSFRKLAVNSSQSRRSRNKNR